MDRESRRKKLLGSFVHLRELDTVAHDFALTNQVVAIRLTHPGASRTRKCEYPVSAAANAAAVISSICFLTCDRFMKAPFYEGAVESFESFTTIGAAASVGRFFDGL
jgi:hypothetical protein